MRGQRKTTFVSESKRPRQSRHMRLASKCRATYSGHHPVAPERGVTASSKRRQPRSAFWPWPRGRAVVDTNEAQSSQFQFEAILESARELTSARLVLVSDVDNPTLAGSGPGAQAYQPALMLVRDESVWKRGKLDVLKDEALHFQLGATLRLGMRFHYGERSSFREISPFRSHIHAEVPRRKRHERWEV